VVLVRVRVRPQLDWLKATVGSVADKRRALA
jgi:hypothetical protein